MNKRLFLIFILFLCIIGLVGCGNNNEDSNKQEENQGDKQEEVIIEKDIIKDGESEYKFLCAEKATKEVIFSLKTLADKVKEKTDVKFTCYRDTFNSEEGRCEVLVGLTNRNESIQVYEKLGKNSYAVEIVGNCIVIAGSDNATLVLALYEFEKRFINDSNYCGIGYLKVSSSLCFMETLTEDLTVKKIIDLGYTPYASIEKFITVLAENDIKVAQGACTDGEFFYFILRDSGDSKAYIKKYDMDGNFVSISPQIYLGHGNDLTYDCDKDYLVCAHGVSESNTYSIINKDTLTVESSFNVESKGGGGSVTYNPILKMYATSKGGETLSFYDADFNYIKTVNRVVNEYTAQGIGSDEELVYAPMSGSSDNVLVAYDWDGNFVANIYVETSAESETMFYYDGQYYLNFYVPGTGAVLYKMYFTIKYE